jgi:hypothetical protein
MKPFEVNVSSKYGAPMGRRETANLEGKVHLQRVPLYDGCYDKGGAYWGGPSNLWCAWNDKGTQYLRAGSRVEAKTMLPECKFYK